MNQPTDAELGQADKTIRLPLLSIFQHYGGSHPHQNTNLDDKERHSFNVLKDYISNYHKSLVSLSRETAQFIHTRGVNSASLPSHLSFQHLEVIQTKINQSIQALQLEHEHVLNMLLQLRQ